MDKGEMREKELEKYVKLYSERPEYGDYNHGKDLLYYFRKRNLWSDEITSILDAGCGNGIFLLELQEIIYHQRNHYMGDNECIKLKGIDFAAIPEEGIIVDDDFELIRGNICSLPFEDNSIDIITCFDVLEHLLEFDVLIALKELGRVAKKELFLKPHYRESNGRGIDGEDLHPTIKPESWWIAQIKSLRVESVERMGHLGDDLDPITSMLHVIL